MAEIGWLSRVTAPVATAKRSKNSSNIQNFGRRTKFDQVLAEILRLSQGIFELADVKISATHVTRPTPGRIDRNSTVLCS